jgi:tetratricopeptide (TPR) repeat protein
MAIYFPGHDAILLLPPKTGSKWVRRALVEADVEHKVLFPPDWRDHGTLKVHGRGHQFTGSFVRDPVDWFKSYWAYRSRHGWNDRAEIDRCCKAGDFSQFIRNIVIRLPGILSEMYQSYVGPSQDPITFIGKQESLSEDLALALDYAGITARGSWGHLGRINASENRPQCSEEIEDLILFSEIEAMCRFGYINNRRDCARIGHLAQLFPSHLTNLQRLALWTEATHWGPDSRYLTNGHGSRARGTRYARLMGNFALYIWNVLNKPDLAWEYFEGALKHDSDHPRTLGNAALFKHLVANDFDEAERLFLRALAVRPNHAYNLGNYAYFLSTRLGRHSEACTLFERSLSLDPENILNGANYAACLGMIPEKNEQAREVFLRILAMDSHSRAIWLQYGEFCERSGQLIESKNAFINAMNIPVEGENRYCLRLHDYNESISQKNH